jgi:hypothetical protein
MASSAPTPTWLSCGEDTDGPDATLPMNARGRALANYGLNLTG